MNCYTSTVSSSVLSYVRLKDNKTTEEVLQEQAGVGFKQILTPLYTERYRSDTNKVDFF